MSDHDDQSVFGGSPGSANESLIVTPRDCPSSARRRTSRRLPQRSPSYSPAPRPQEPRTSRAAAQRLRFPSPVRPGARGATASGIAPSGVGRRARRRRRSPAVDPARTSTASGSPTAPSEVERRMRDVERRKRRSRAPTPRLPRTRESSHWGPPNKKTQTRQSRWKLGQGTSQDWYCPECGNCVPRDRRRCFRCSSSHPPLPVERLEGRARSAGAR